MDFYSDHWAANRLDAEFLWGPEVALRFVEQREPVDPLDGWLDDVWCEGGALLDLERHRLGFFGGEDVLWDPDLRRTWRRVMAATWPGWTIDWYDRGIQDLARDVAVAPEVVRSGRELGPAGARGGPATVREVRVAVQRINQALGLDLVPPV